MLVAAGARLLAAEREESAKDWCAARKALDLDQPRGAVAADWTATEVC